MEKDIKKRMCIYIHTHIIYIYINIYIYVCLCVGGCVCKEMALGLHGFRDYGPEKEPPEKYQSAL